MSSFRALRAHLADWISPMPVASLGSHTLDAVYRFEGDQKKPYQITYIFTRSPGGRRVCKTFCSDVAYWQTAEQTAFYAEFVFPWLNGAIDDESLMRAIKHPLRGKAPVLKLVHSN